jgi:simple sugar transport system substrate-binding protein
MKRIDLFLILLIIGAAGCQAVPTVEPTQAPAPGHTPQPASPGLPAPASQTTSLHKTYKDMVVGFVEHWGEGGWYVVNRDSFRLAALDLGITLKINEIAKPDPEANQDMGIRGFIADPNVNVIVIAAHKRTGWDEILKEVQASGKVVIFEGFPMEASENLYATYVGSDYVEQGRKAGQAMIELLGGSEKKNIVQLAGGSDSSVAKDRGQGFREAIQGSGLVITQSQTANWSREEGKQVMAAFLATDQGVQGVFAQSDEMALGAIEAIKEAGLKPGIDIKIVSIDGTSAALQAMIAGDLNVTTETNPWLGPQVYEAALKALNGETLPKRIATKENIYADPLQAQEELQRRREQGIEW